MLVDGHGRRRTCSIGVTGALMAILLVCCPAASAAALEPIGTFDQPVTVTSHPDDADRPIVAEREGVLIEVSAAGQAVLADFSALVSCCSDERGLNSIVLAPDFGESGRFYAAYAGTSAAGGQAGDLHIDSFRLAPIAGDDLIREPILAIDHDQNGDHYGGQLQFGPDGYLYISVGDGGGAGDPLGSGQSVETLLGKILRIDPQPGEVPAHTSPDGNPFVSVSGLDEIWAYGLRNPWRFSFDRATGDMTIGDVGQGLREEIDYSPSPATGVVGGAGANYGWNCREGFIAFPGAAAGCPPPMTFVDPVFDYSHTAPDGTHRCAVIAGYVARDPSLVELYGRYVYGDLCSGEIRSLVLPAGAGVASDDRSEGLAVEGPVSFGEDSSGRLYVASVTGAVYRFRKAAPRTTPATSSATAIPSTALALSRLRLRVEKVWARGARIVASVAPCAGHGGEEVSLNRGGRPLAVKRFDDGCVARFFVRVMQRATFRAVLNGDPGLRSRRLAISREPA